MSKTVRVHHAMLPGSKPKDYILIQPECLEYNKFTPTRIVKCPFGPLVMWVGKGEEKCAFCSGCGELEVHGDNGECAYVECPKCFGGGTEEHFEDECVWSDAYGNIIEPELIYHGSVNFTVSERWIAEWVEKQQD